MLTKEEQEYADAVRRYFGLYHQLQKEHLPRKIRHTVTITEEESVIRIYKECGKEMSLIMQIKDDEDTGCWNRAADEVGKMLQKKNRQETVL